MLSQSSLREQLPIHSRTFQRPLVSTVEALCTALFLQAIKGLIGFQAGWLPSSHTCTTVSPHTRCQPRSRSDRTHFPQPDLMMLHISSSMSIQQKISKFSKPRFSVWSWFSFLVDFFFIQWLNIALDFLGMNETQLSLTQALILPTFLKRSL